MHATTLVKAPARLVIGALIELASRQAQLVSVGETEMVAASGLTGRCVSTDEGTLLTCSLPEMVEDVRARAESLVGARVVVGTAIVRDGRLLAQQRAFPAEVAGLWELPGGRVEPGETDHEAVRRECVEELGVAVTPGEAVGPDVILPGGRLLRIYRAWTDEDPVAVEHKAVRWLDDRELGEVDWLPADRLLLPVFQALVGT